MFEGGYKDKSHVAAPILSDYGIPFMVFVSNGYVDQESNNFLSLIELGELASIAKYNNRCSWC